MTARTVPATFSRMTAAADPQWERGLGAFLKETHSRAELMSLLAKHSAGDGALDAMMRRVLLGAICKRVGEGLRVGANAVFVHPETMEIGDFVFIGSQAMIQGRFDGTCRIGNHVWIGPQAYFDARCLEIQDYVGWGPGAKVLGSSHTGDPIGEPVIRTDLVISPVVIGYGADVGMNASLLPGVTIGAHAIIGAGAVVTKDVPEYAIAAGVPARVLRDRRESEPDEQS